MFNAIQSGSSFQAKLSGEKCRSKGQTFLNFTAAAKRTHDGNEVLNQQGAASAGITEHVTSTSAMTSDLETVDSEFEDQADTGVQEAQVTTLNEGYLVDQMQALINQFRSTSVQGKNSRDLEEVSSERRARKVIGLSENIAYCIDRLPILMGLRCQW